MATTKAKHVYTEVSYEPDCYIMFGKESAGIPEEILVRHPDECIRIPMLGETRSLNLANSVAIVLYEALRQQDFADLRRTGSCTGCSGRCSDCPAAVLAADAHSLTDGFARRTCLRSRKVGQPFAPCLP